MANKNYKVCVICGKCFPSPPSAKVVTCSPKCRSARARMARLARTDLDHFTEAQRAKFRDSEKCKARAKYAQPIATAAAMKLPAGQRGCQNRGSKLWIITTPSGAKIAAINLLQFVRDNADAFDIDASDDKAAHSVASGFRIISRTYLGKNKGRPVYHCHEFGLAGPAIDFPADLCCIEAQTALNLWFSGNGVDGISEKTKMPEKWVRRVLQAAGFISASNPPRR